MCIGSDAQTVERLINDADAVDSPAFDARPMARRINRINNTDEPESAAALWRVNPAVCTHPDISR